MSCIMFGSDKLWENGAAAERTAIQSNVSTTGLSNISKPKAMLSEEGNRNKAC